MRYGTKTTKKRTTSIPPAAYNSTVNRKSLGCSNLHSSPWWNVLETVILTSFEHLSYISCFVRLPVGEKSFRQAETKSKTFDSAGQCCDRVSSASHLPVWLFSFWIMHLPVPIGLAVGRNRCRFFHAQMIHRILPSFLKESGSAVMLTGFFSYQNMDMTGKSGKNLI